MLPISHLPKKIFLIFISILASFTFLPVFSFCVLLPCWLFRSLAIVTGRCYPNLYRVLSVDSCLTAVDAIYTLPRCSLVSIQYIKGPLPTAQFRERMSSLLNSEKFPELRCHLSRWLGTFFWSRCSNFDLDHHFSESEVTTYTEFRAVVESLIPKPFVKGRPLWEIVTFPNYQDPKLGTSSAYALRFHHSLCDGYGLTCLLKAIEDPNTDIKDGLKVLKAKFKSQRKEAMGLSYYLKLFLVTPAHTLYTILNNFNSNPWTLPVGKRVGDGDLVFYESTGHVDLEWVKGIAKRRGHRFTTVVVEGVTSAIRTTLLEQGHKIEKDLSLVYPWPKPGHPGTLTNYAFALPIVAPISIADRETRLKFISKEFKKWHRSPLIIGIMAACSGFGMLQGMLNTSARFVGHFGTLILTNFLFFPKIGTLFGSEVNKMDCLLGLTEPMVSLVLGVGGYNGKLNLSVKADRAIFSNKKAAERFVDLIVQEFEILDKETSTEMIKIV